MLSQLVFFLFVFVGRPFNDLFYIVAFEVGILKDSNIETPVVCNIFDVNGEVSAGVASVEAVVSGFFLHKLTFKIIKSLEIYLTC